MVASGDKVNKVSFVFFDLETTGLSPQWGHEICEFGAVRSVGGEVVDSCSMLINPGRPIPPEKFSISGITDVMVKDAPRFDEVYPTIMSCFGDSILVAHNAPFDVKFLSFTFQKYEYPALDNIILDNLQISKKIHPNFPSHSLMALKSRFGIYEEHDHRALDDSEALSTIFNKYLEELKDEDVITVGDLLEFHGPALPFPELQVDMALVNPVFLELVEEALKAEKELSMGYSSAASQSVTRWYFKPVQVFEKGEYIYFKAQCNANIDEMVFRLDRVVDMKPIDEEF